MGIRDLGAAVGPGGYTGEDFRDSAWLEDGAALQTCLLLQRAET